MPQIETKYFGTVEYEGGSVFTFPQGLPGFEAEHEFLFIEQPVNKPLVFVQSLASPELCFPTIAARALEPQYRLTLSAEEAGELGLETDQPAEIGPDLLCLVILSIEEGLAPTANLLSPLVVNVRLRRGLQTVQTGSGYPLRHPLGGAGGEARCL